MLRINNLKKTYGGKNKPAVDNLSIHVKPGDIYGFIGHNGAGKTTTIKCATGILDFTDGEIYINGMSVKEKPLECKRLTAYIPDNPDLYESMTGIGYLKFISDIYSLSRQQREENIKKYADMFSLTGALGDIISSYSHGMKQKLAIISALIHEPRLLILDEPFVGLDPTAAHTVKELMRTMCENGSAVFFSTHVLEVAEKLCNKIAIIKQGRLVADGDINSVKGDSSLEQLFLELTQHE